MPAPPAAARELFGPKLPLAEAYAALLASAGVEHGLIGPGEASRIWDRHLINSGLVVALLPAIVRRAAGARRMPEGAGQASGSPDSGDSVVAGQSVAGELAVGGPGLVCWLIWDPGLVCPG